MDLLFDLFKGLEIATSSNVFTEIRRAEERGYRFCEDILDLVHDAEILVLSPTHKEYIIANNLPSSFGLGERDSVAMAQSRKATIVTNERKVVNFCRRREMEMFNLNHILRALWVLEILSKDDVKILMSEMEREDNLVITSKKEILSD